MRKLLSLALLLLVLGAPGCELFKIHGYDPVTVQQIEQTIVFETEDFQLTVQALKDLGAPDEVIFVLQLRHESELARLSAWKLAEEAKKLEDDS